MKSSSTLCSKNKNIRYFTLFIVVFDTHGTLLRWGGRLKHNTANAALEAKGTEPRIRARGQHATTIEARKGRLRHIIRAMEAELKWLDIPPVFRQLLHEALLAANASTFYNEVSPYNALF
eukprot:5890211-Pyramimonas_sp.AAC.1